MFVLCIQLQHLHLYWKKCERTRCLCERVLSWLPHPVKCPNDPDRHIALSGAKKHTEEKKMSFEELSNLSLTATDFRIELRFCQSKGGG